MAEVCDVGHKSKEDPAVFLKQVVDAFCHYSHLEEAESSNTVASVFVNQLTPDIRRKLQNLARLGKVIEGLHRGGREGVS